MAGTRIEKKIATAIGRLCDAMGAIYTNFFDPSTLQQVHQRTAIKRRIIPTSTYACGQWHAGDDVGLICISNQSLETSLACFRENVHLDEAVKLPRAEGFPIVALSKPELSQNADPTLCCLSSFFELSRRGQVCRFPQEEGNVLTKSLRLPAISRSSSSKLPQVSMWTAS